MAETTYKGRRLIVRRTRLTDRAQRRLWPDWRHHAFLTDLDGTTADVDAFHRRHAEVELAIRDLKEGAGMERPLGAVLRQRRLAVLRGAGPQPAALERHPGTAIPDRRAVLARTVRTRLIAIPARLVNRAGTPPLRGPLHWPWAGWFTARLAALRALPDTS